MTWLKICGTTNLGDAQLSIAAGADALGFVFAPSPRRVDVLQVSAICAKLPSGVEKIGVFVNESPRRVGEIVGQLPLSGVQLHGDEPAEQMKDFRKALGGRMISKTLQAGDILNAGEEHLAKYLSASANLDAILLDSGAANVRGGTGVPFAWEQVAPLAATIRDALPLIVAGGLNAENVAQAMEWLDPWGVDVVSGVEREPGRKDQEKLRSFVAAVRRAKSPARL
jgi:phosphoribosylanthranilate isomerase